MYLLTVENDNYMRDTSSFNGSVPEIVPTMIILCNYSEFVNAYEIILAPIRSASSLFAAGSLWIR